MEGVKNVLPANFVTSLSFFVNGKKVVEPDPQPEWTLLWYLRNKLQLTGSKYGCGEGGCGACTVMLSRNLPAEDRVKHVAVNSCLTPVCGVHGQAVTTVEGIGSLENGLHPVQERIAKAHGSQCGFCTPGFVMSMYALLRNKNNIEYEDIETALQGNLCRCTGYRPIIDGFITFTDAWQSKYGDKQCGLGVMCCKNKENTRESLCHLSKFKPYNKSQEPIFPPELKLDREKYAQSYLFFEGLQAIWLRPRNLKEIIQIKSHFLSAKLVAGNTEVGFEIKITGTVYPLMVSITSMPDLTFFKQDKEGISFGSAVALTDMKEKMEDIIKTDPDRTIFCKAIVDMLHWFAATQVRNVAVIVGNIITACPISDLNPILMACNAHLNAVSLKGGERKLPIDEAFFISNRKVSLREDEVVLSVEIPYSVKKQYFKAYKQARRKEDDISIVTSAFNVILDDDNRVAYSRICFGGMAPTTICATKTCEAINGRKWNSNILQTVLNSLNTQFQFDVSVPGGMAEYRKTLSISMFFKFYMWVLKNISNNNTTFENKALNDLNINALGEPESSQYFEIKDAERKPTNVVGLPIPHVSALKQATGEALYCDDIPHVQSELFLTLILSQKSHAKVLEIDASDALSLPGVVAFLSAKDLDKDCNKLGPIFKDEEIFSSDEVTSQACVIGAIVAENESIARKAKKLVKVNYEDLQSIITIEDAVIYKSYFPGSPRNLKKGDVDKAFDEAPHTLKGSVRSGAQEHFYLEPYAAFAIRKEDELEIISSTQAPAEMAALAAHALKLPNHKVVAKTKRIGGGFGGKETRTAVLTVPVAIAAYKLRRAVRAVLDRDEDMQCTGYRHPVLIKYEVAFDDDGRIIGAKFDLYSNAGNSMDISCSMNERAVMHVDNVYFIPNIEVNGYLCKTNLPSNTAFRGFGGPQAMFAAENMIRDIAIQLNKPYEEIVSINLYKEGYLTHFNQVLSHCTVERCWNECIEISDYRKRLEEISEFNRSNRWQKKGIALTPTKYGISFQSDLLMQAGALLNIHTDGSVLLSIGGIEMGQGLFTKMIQVASNALEIDIERVHISETSTDKVPNSSPTAASISSDLYGMAVLDACQVLNQRLKPFKESNPEGKWEDWILAAYFDRVQLSATGFYCAPKILYDPKTNSGDLYEYFTFGVACSEIIIDCLTGDHNVLRSDIVMDVGESLNPAIDIGQIEGAFMQGYGLFTLEELVFSPNGTLISKGPGMYKIPSILDIPKKFNVSLLKGAPNPRAVYSSKAIGEPPLFLAASVFFAIKEAIRAARLDAGLTNAFALNAPATCEQIRRACEDDIIRQVRPTVKSEGITPWTVIV